MMMSLDDTCNNNLTTRRIMEYEEKRREELEKKENIMKNNHDAGESRVDEMRMRMLKKKKINWKKMSKEKENV